MTILGCNRLDSKIGKKASLTPQNWSPSIIRSTNKLKIAFILNVEKGKFKVIIN
jgi:hypothetical protein